MRSTVAPSGVPCALALQWASLLAHDPARVPAGREASAVEGLAEGDLREACRILWHLEPADLASRGRVDAAARLLREGAEPEAVWRAVGFPSPSAGREAFQARMGLAPEAWAALEGTAFRMALPPDFRVADVLAYHGRDPLSLCERVEGARLLKALAVPEGVRVLELAFDGPSVAVRLHGGAGDPVRLHGTVRRMLGLAQDPGPFEAACRRDPAFHALVSGRPGLRVPLTATVWEALVWAVLGQQVNLAFAYALRRELVGAFGAPAGPGLTAHPGPGDLASLEALPGVRLSRAKAACLLGAARAVASGALDLEGDLPAPALEAALLALKGVGPWTAQYVLMRGRGFDDCVPVGDAGLVVALVRHHGLDHRPGPAETLALLAPFAPWRSLAVFHLWASLQGVPA